MLTSVLRLSTVTRDYLLVPLLIRVIKSMFKFSLFLFMSTALAVKIIDPKLDSDLEHDICSARVEDLTANYDIQIFRERKDVDNYHGVIIPRRSTIYEYSVAYAHFLKAFKDWNTAWNIVEQERRIT